MKLKEFFGKLASRYLLFHLLAMVLFVIVLCIGVKYGLNIYTHHGEGTKLPDLTGVDFKRAISQLGADGIYLSVTDSTYNESLPAGAILNQQPGPGTMVKQGRTIFVTLNASKAETIAIEDLIDNSSYREAQAKLLSKGFKMLEPKRVEGEKDWVYGILYQGRSLQTGDIVPEKSELTLVIGNGYDEEEDENMMLDVPDESETAGEVDEFEEVTAP